MEAVHELQGSKSIYSIDFHRNGRYIATSGEGGEVGVWDLKTVIYTSLSAGDAEDSIMKVAFSPDGLYLAVYKYYFREGGVSIFCCETWVLLAKLRTESKTRCVIFDPNGAGIIIAGYNCPLKLWSWNSQENPKLLTTHSVSGAGYTSYILNLIKSHIVLNQRPGTYP
jgi:WD40 repeat protein